VLTTGCDKTTPACLMGAATVNMPASVLSGGPMLDGWWKGRLSGSGTIIWEGRKLYAEGKIDYEQFMQMVASSAPSVGHCNTMGTALSMNSLAEALGMSLPGCAAIPAPHKERGWMAYHTGHRIVGMVHEDSQILRNEHLHFDDRDESEGLKEAFATDAASIARGRSLFVERCQSCHGSEGHGGGPVSKFFPPAPDLGYPAIQVRPDGYLYATVLLGGRAMPVMREGLSQTDLWDLVHFVRTVKPKAPP